MLTRRNRITSDQKQANLRAAINRRNFKILLAVQWLEQHRPDVMTNIEQLAWKKYPRTTITLDPITSGALSELNNMLNESMQTQTPDSRAANAAIRIVPLEQPDDPSDDHS